jgi:hypothetical protein
MLVGIESLRLIKKPGCCLHISLSFFLLLIDRMDPAPLIIHWMDQAPKFM